MSKILIDKQVLEQAIYHLNRAGLPAPWSTAEALRAALEQPQDHFPDAGNRVPTGWKLVPVDPTDDMLYDIQEYSHILPPRGRRIWAHMLAAAPQPPTVKDSLTTRPQVEQEPVAWMYDEAKYGPTDLRGQQWRPTLSLSKPYTENGMVRELTPLYTHPQNLHCKSNQARLATLWGYEKPQPLQPLTDEQINNILKPLLKTVPYNWKAITCAIEAAHEIKGENSND